MSRQSFVATDFFIAASEKAARAQLHALVEKVENTSLISKNSLTQITRFAHHNTERGETYHLDVSLLPLNDQFIRVNIHASHADGHIFQNDANLSAVMALFKAMLTGEEAVADSEAKRGRTAKKESPILNALFSLFLSKYHY